MIFIVMVNSIVSIVLHIFAYNQYSILINLIINESFTSYDVYSFLYSASLRILLLRDLNSSHHDFQNQFQNQIKKQIDHFIHCV